MDTEKAINEYYIIITDDEKVRLLKIAFGAEYINYI